MISVSKERATPLMNAQGVPIVRAYLGAGWQASVGNSKGLAAAFARRKGIDLDALAMFFQGTTCIRIAGFDTLDPFGDGSAQHSGDNRKGSADGGDNEYVTIDLDRIPGGVDHVVFALVAWAEGVSFSQVANVTATIKDRDSGQSTKLYPPVVSGSSTLLIARFDRTPDGWTSRELGSMHSARLREQLIQVGADAIRAT